jgi:hypothetical protein
LPLAWLGAATADGAAFASLVLKGIRRVKFSAKVH